MDENFTWLPCPHCLKKLHVPYYNIGLYGKCSFCGTRIKLRPDSSKNGKVKEIDIPRIVPLFKK